MITADNVTVLDSFTAELGYASRKIELQEYDRDDWAGNRYGVAAYELIGGRWDMDRITSTPTRALADEHYARVISVFQA